MAGRTRAKTEHPLFEQPSDLPSAQLPTVGDALNLAIKQGALDVSTIWIKAVVDRTKVQILPQKLI